MILHGISVRFYEPLAGYLADTACELSEEASQNPSYEVMALLNGSET